MDTITASFATAGAVVAVMIASIPNSPAEHGWDLFLPREFLQRRETPVPNECWTRFLESLRKLDAVVYFPEDKAILARRYGFIFREAAWQTQKNAEVTLNFMNFMPVEPGSRPGNDSCSAGVQTTFRELGMVVLVQKNRAAGLEQLSLKPGDRTIKCDGGSQNRDQDNKAKTFEKMTDQQLQGDRTKQKIPENVSEYFLKLQIPGRPSGPDGYQKCVPASQF